MMKETYKRRLEAAALRKRTLETVRVLLAYGAEPSPDQVRFCARFGRYDIAKSLMSAGISPDNLGPSQVEYVVTPEGRLEYKRKQDFTGLLWALWGVATIKGFQDLFGEGGKYSPGSMVKESSSATPERKE